MGIHQSFRDKFNKHEQHDAEEISWNKKRYFNLKFQYVHSVVSDMYLIVPCPELLILNLVGYSYVDNARCDLEHKPSVLNVI